MRLTPTYRQHQNGPEIQVSPHRRKRKRTKASERGLRLQDPYPTPEPVKIVVESGEVRMPGRFTRILASSRTLRNLDLSPVSSTESLVTEERRAGWEVVPTAVPALPPASPGRRVSGSGRG